MLYILCSKFWIVSFLAPSTLEYLNTTSELPVYNGNASSEFNITCIVSASNIDALVIQKDEQNLDDLYFGSSCSVISCENGCSYGLETALKLESYWKVSEHDFDNCKDILHYDGAYQCVATTITAGFENTSYYGPIIVETECMYKLSSYLI